MGLTTSDAALGDGQCSIRIARDAMMAWLSISNPEPGQCLTQAAVICALRQAGVVKGELRAEIESALASGDGAERVVACGVEAIPGTDACFESQLADVHPRAPKVDEHGIVDYRDLGGIAMVKPGDPLLRKLPATTGTPGYDVLGRELPAKPGKDRPFAQGLSGVGLDPADPNLLVATIAGQPRCVPDGMVVDPVLALCQADVTTGNIEFDGTVRISGDVRAEMRVRASGDVIVGGTVEAAEIDAGGNVLIAGGIVGRTEGKSAAGDSTAGKWRVRAAGSVKARFIENAIVEAGVDILVEEFALNSSLTGLNRVIVGKSRSSNGRIIGGVVRATTLVRAASVGSPAGVRTRIRVGVHPRLEEAARKAQDELKSIDEQHDGLTKLLTFLREHPERNRAQLCAKAEDTLAMLLRQGTRVREQLAETNAAMTLAAQARIQVDRIMHAGTEIRFGSATLTLTDDEAACQFLLDGRDVQRQPIPVE